MSNYKVSARKYRPQSFSEVTSQEFVTQTMKNAIISGKTAHSYLLSGPRGVGKTTIARIYAKAMNCTNLKNGEPCNKCNSCEEITNGVHPDVFELDAASNRGIDDVRAIQDAAKFFPIKGKYKFFIVDEVHMLTQQAFNALLKILEEPPPYLIFILATTNPEKIPATIVSRCQRFPLQRIRINEISDKVREIAKEEKIKIDDESVFLIAKLGDGALRDALGVFDMAVSFCGENIKYNELKSFLNIPDKEIYFNFSEFIRNGDIKSILTYFNELEEKGFDMQTFFNGITEHLRDLLIVKSTSNPELLDESDSFREKYSSEAENFTTDQLQRLLKVMFETENRFRYSSNQKILLESILAELCTINRDVHDLSEIISDLTSLKKKSLTEESGEELNTEKTEDEIPVSGSHSSDTPEQEAKSTAAEIKSDKKIRSKKNGKESLSDKSGYGDPDYGDLKSDKKPSKETEIIEKLKELFDVEEYKKE
ncbi:MAG: DNA polymerase III subunit gamma/tau [Bacteroidetes bacterium]|nr:DNA polymerase III subunit gamma/tau [Bacteroidota bacterium]